MDATAIEIIGQTAIDADGNRLPEPLRDRLAAIPQDYALHDLERFDDERRRFRGTLTTNSLNDFAEYAKRRAETGSAKVPVFIDAEKRSAQAFFNLGNELSPGHADDIALLTLPPTAAFAALLAIEGKRLTQADLIDWIEDWREQMAPRLQDGAEEPSSIAKAIAAIRTITVKATSETESDTRDFGARRTAMDDVEARSRGVLPAGFTFQCAPCAGLSLITAQLRLAVITAGDKPTLSLRVIGREALLEGVAQDFKAVLDGKLGGVAEITIGTFKP